MPIISSNFNQIGNSGQQPGTCFIETDDSLTTIQTTGYLNTLERQGLPLSENLMALVGINKGAAKSTVWMAIHFSNGEWSLVPSAIEPSLNAKYLIQQPNATLPNAQAMSALATGIVKNTTTTGVQSIAIANVDYQPALSGESLTAVTVATDDKILIQDTSDSNNLKTVTTQSVANLFAGVTSVSGTTNRITSTGGTTPVIDISASYVGQSSITTVGTVSSGTWNGTTVDVSHGGTGVATMTTAYAPICAGTTATGALQVASTGQSTSGFVLTSTGASSLPTWQAAGGGGMSWANISGTTQSAAVNTGYVIGNASQTTVTLPTTAALGSVVAIQGQGAAGWVLAPGDGQKIKEGGASDSTSITSATQYDTIEEA